MAKDKTPMTPAMRALKAAGSVCIPHLYKYGGGKVALNAAQELGVDPHAVVKTLVFLTAEQQPLLVLMHGDQEVSAKNLARELGTKGVEPAPPAQAERLTGYQVGGVSPLGTRTPMPVYVQATVLDLPIMYLNGGKRGFLVEIAPAELAKALAMTAVEMAA